MKSEKLIRIGFDLDGVFVDKPPFVPKNLLEWLVRSHQTKRLAYRYPTLKPERWLRKFSHHPFFRPPIKKNLELVKRLGRKGKYRLYIISGRYSFLENRTWQWLKRYKIKKLFAGVFINLENKQPHLFKEKMIRDLGIKLFIDDDLPLAEHLANSNLRVKIFCFDKKSKKESSSSVALVESLEEIFSQ